jgi:hypothetical protein
MMVNVIFFFNIATSTTDDKYSEIINIFLRLWRLIYSFRFIIFILNMYYGMCIYTFILVNILLICFKNVSYKTSSFGALKREEVLGEKC